MTTQDTTIPSNHYVSNKELLVACKTYSIDYKQSLLEGKELPRMSNDIGSAIYRICKNIMNNFNFVNYSFKDDMISDAIVKCVAKAHNFNHELSDNPFAYFSQIAWNSGIERIKKERHQTSVKAKMVRERMSSDFMSHAEAIDDADMANSYIEFLKENDVLVDHYEDRKTKIHDSLVHRNKTAYPVKGEAKKAKQVEDTMDIFEV